MGSDPDGDRRAVTVDNRVIDLARRILRETPATTLAGLATKLRVAFVETGKLEDHQDEWGSGEWSLWLCWRMRNGWPAVPSRLPGPIL
ncbi:MAG: hypothetical protein V3T84_12365 [Phycisphaerales bacterium]